jgi:hypothetical protein
MNWSESNWELQALEAEISLSYKTAREAEAVADAVSPDNVNAPRGLTVKTTRLGTRVLTKIECRTKLPTFIATIDDLMSAVSIAEKSTSAVKKL